MASYTSSYHQVSCLQSAESVRRYGRRKSREISVKSPTDLHSLRSRRDSCLPQYSRLWPLLRWQISNLGKSWRYWRIFVAAVMERFLGTSNSSKHQPQVVSSSVRGDVQAELPAAWATAHGLPFGECTPAWCSVLPVCAAVWCGFQWSSVASSDGRTPLCCSPHTHRSRKPIASRAILAATLLATKHPIYGHTLLYRLLGLLAELICWRRFSLFFRFSPTTKESLTEPPQWVSYYITFSLPMHLFRKREINCCQTRFETVITNASYCGFVFDVGQ